LYQELGRDNPPVVVHRPILKFFNIFSSQTLDKHGGVVPTRI